MKDITQKVEYFGGTANTHFGAVMFEADRYLKSLAAGKDTLTGQPINPNVPGFKSELDLGFEMKVETPWHRNWFVPGEIVLKQSVDGHSMTFEKANIILQSRFIEFLPDNTLQDIVGSSPVTDQFTKFMNAHYTEFADGKPELAELVELAKIVGFVRWLHENNIPVDLSWVNDYPITYVKTSESTPGVVAERSDGNYTIISMGGVGYDTDNTYSKDTDSESQTLAKKVADSRPPDNPITWEIKSGGETLTAVAFNTAPTSIIGGFSTSATDLTIPTVGGQKISFTRQYNSLDLRHSIFGSGWSLVTPKLKVLNIPSLENPNQFYTEIELATGNNRQTFSLANDGFFYQKDAISSGMTFGITSDDDFTPVALDEDVSFQIGLGNEPFKLLDNQDNSLEYNGFALVKQDNSVMAFDNWGRIIAQRDMQGNQLNYSYSDDQLSSITDNTDRSLQLSYDTNNVLSDLLASTGQSIHFTYNSARLLSSVVNETGSQLYSYGYGPDNRLNQVTDQFGQVFKISYDGLGRVVSSSSPDGDWTIMVNDKTNDMTYTNSYGSTITLQYDTENRLISETILGSIAKYKYDNQGNVLSFTDFNGNVYNYQYDERGYMSEIDTPQGDRTILWNTNEFGLPEGLIDSNNGITFYKYDDLGRVTSVESGIKLNKIDSNGGINFNADEALSVNYNYDSNGNLATIQDAVGLVTKFIYNEIGNLTGVYLPGGGEMHQAFDNLSRLTSISDATGYRTDFSYNDQEQLVNISTSAGQTKFSFTNNLITSVTDPLNNTTQYSYNDASQLISVTNPDGSITAYEYDDIGKVSAIIDAMGKRVDYEYDMVGHLIGIYR